MSHLWSVAGPSGSNKWDMVRHKWDMVRHKWDEGAADGATAARATA